MSLDFKKFNTGTLFLVRTPDTFPVGYAEKSFADMKNNLHFDYAALLETWNCDDGVLWKTDKFPRSSYWKNEERDPIEECFCAADKYDMAFLPEAGVIDSTYLEAHSDAMFTTYEGLKHRYGRLGLAPTCPYTLEYLKTKYDTLIEKFGHHKSFKGICMPCETGISTYLSYDKYTKEAWREKFNTEIPTPDELEKDKELFEKSYVFQMESFLGMYNMLAKYLKDKYNLPLMHYPLGILSQNCYFQPGIVAHPGNVSIMNKVKELDLLNMQIHPPLNPNPYFFKLETEFLMGNAEGMPCVADTHFYHECSAGRLPDFTPKRFVDNILSTLTPYGVSFFCYGFMAEELPLWKKELNPGAPVYSAYQEPHTVKARRKFILKGMNYVECLRPLLEKTEHSADCAIYFPESIGSDYVYGSYSIEHIFGLHELFNAASIPVKIISKVPSHKDEQKMIVFDSITSLSKEDINSLGKYIASGGKVLIIGKCCDEIEKLAKINVKHSSGTFIKSENSNYFNHCFIRLPMSGNHYQETNGVPVLYYNNGEVAVAKRDNIFYFGACDSIDRFSHYRDFNLASWWKTYFTQEKLNSGVEYHNVYINSVDNHQFVSCDIFKNNSKQLLLIRNYGVDQNKATVSWDIPANSKVVGAWADGVKFEFKNNEALPKYEHFVVICIENK